MNPSEIDDALRRKREIEPSPHFRAKVMHAVRIHSAAGRSRHRWWQVMWPVAAVASVAAAVLISGTLLDSTNGQPGEMSEITRWLTLTLTGTVAIAWRGTRRPA